ncbi:MAG: hypothetical protein MJ233_00770 [Mycoplasmoidaceae bacterium]|nr:hypothetical protein [Mycoplasmoidaceae bacterium]
MGVVNAETIQAAAQSLGVAEASVFNLGVFLVPIITSAFCMGGFCFAFLMPKQYTAELVYKQFNLNKRYEVVKPSKIKQRIQYPFDAASIAVYNAL